MANPDTVDPEPLEILADQPIVISGQPGNLRGTLHLSNRSDKPVVVRSVRLPPSRELQGLMRSKAPGQGMVMRMSPGIIRAGHSGPVTLSLSLDPYTPPGEYHIQAEISGETRPVIVHVAEKVALRLSPSELVIENRPGGKSQKRIILENRGNVPLAFGEFGVVFLDDDLLTCRTLRAAAASVDDELRPLEEYLARILLSAKQVAESSGILRIHSLAGKFDLQPGEVRPVDLEVRVPEGLDRRGRFRGTLALYTANLTLVVVPGSGPQPSETTQRSDRSTRSRGARSSGKKEVSS